MQMPKLFIFEGIPEHMIFLERCAVQSKLFFWRFFELLHGPQHTEDYLTRVIFLDLRDIVDTIPRERY